MQLTESLKSVFIETSKALSGSERRLFMARVVVVLGVGGQRLAEAFFLSNSLRQIPAIAVTAWMTEDGRAIAFESGFDMYVEKPIDPEGLGQLLLSLSEENRHLQKINYALPESLGRSLLRCALMCSRLQTNLIRIYFLSRKSNRSGSS